MANVKDLNLPQFIKTMPEIWFKAAEAILHSSGITDDQEKYNAILMRLDPTALIEVADDLSHPPQNDKYGNIKNKLISVYSEAPDDRLEKLLGDINLGD